MVRDCRRNIGFILILLMLVFVFACKFEDNGEEEGKPDLVVSAVSNYTGWASERDRFYLSYDVTNKGKSRAGAFDVGVYLSIDNVCRRNDIFVCYQRYPSLASRGSTSWSGSCTIPSGTGGNSYFVCAIADDYHSVKESNEKNNANYHSYPLTVSGTGGAEGCPTGFLLDVSLQGAVFQTSITLPLEVGDSCFKQAGMSLDSETNKAQVEVDSVNPLGNRLEIVLKVTNVSAQLLRRVWLVVKSQDADVVADSSIADGYIGEGIYFFLKNLDPGEIQMVTIGFDISLLVDSFDAVLDVVSVRDRIVFQYFTGSTSEIWTADTDGLDQFHAVDVVSPDYAWAQSYSSDGGWIAFGWGLPVVSDIGLARADGNGAIRLTCFGQGYALPGGFTPDGKKLYIRRYDESLGTADVYLLDIAQARSDCSSNASLTPLTGLDGTNESVPSVAPDGSFILFSRRVPWTAEPPYQSGDPNLSTCNIAPFKCPDWVFGSEMEYNVMYQYLMPTDPVTGLPTGPETIYWENSLIVGAPSITPDSNGVVLKSGGGCTLGYKYWCHPDTCQWTSIDTAGHPQCVSSVTGVDWVESGLYRLDIPGDWSALPYDYAYNAPDYTLYPGLVVWDPPPPAWELTYDFYTPNWCWEQNPTTGNNRVVYADKDGNLSDCGPPSCDTDKRLLINDNSGNIATPKCAPAVADP